jgi:hypothetical protein
MNGPSQVIYSATHWLRTWNILQKPGVRDTVLASCRRLEQVLQECFPRLMGGGLVLGLISSSVWEFLFFFLDLFDRVHHGMQKPGVAFKEVVLSRCDLLEFQ